MKELTDIETRMVRHAIDQMRQAERDLQVASTNLREIDPASARKLYRMKGRLMEQRQLISVRHTDDLIAHYRTSRVGDE